MTLTPSDTQSPVLYLNEQGGVSQDLTETVLPAYAAAVNVATPRVTVTATLLDGTVVARRQFPIRAGFITDTSLTPLGP